MFIRLIFLAPLKKRKRLSRDQVKRFKETNNVLINRLNVNYVIIICSLRHVSRSELLSCLLLRLSLVSDNNNKRTSWWSSSTGRIIFETGLLKKILSRKEFTSINYAFVYKEEKQLLLLFFFLFRQAKGVINICSRSSFDGQVHWTMNEKAVLIQSLAMLSAEFAYKPRNNL